MSNKYYAERNRVLRLAPTGRVHAMSADTYEDALYAAETLNKLQCKIDALDELVDIACDIVSDAVIVNEGAPTEGFVLRPKQFRTLKERLDKVRPKTKEQLLKERLELADRVIAETSAAIDHVDCGVIGEMIAQYKAAKKAHES